MSQAWTENTYQYDHVGTTDLQNMENNFTTLKSMFSGAGAPSNAVAGMPWFDTGQSLLKIRNAGNSAWLGVMYGNSSNKIWMYSNSASDGWAIDATVTDRVIALKGGTAAYNTTGGSTAGTWSQGNHTHTISHTHTHNHNHRWVYGYKPYAWSTPIAKTYNSSGTEINVPTANFTNTSGVGRTLQTEIGEQYYYYGVNTSYTNNVTSNTSNSSSANSGTGGTASTWRPGAAVGTLQYPDV